MQHILNDFDADRNALVEPWYIAKPIPGFPEIAVTTFSADVIGAFSALDGVKQISEFRSGNGVVPVYEMEYAGQPIAFYMSKVGAPACLMQFEEIIAKGSRTVVMFGKCGALDQELAEGHFIIPTAAVRDEGASCHYIPASPEIEVDPASIEVLTATMDQMGYSWVKGKTWTLDAPYRETAKKAALRKSQGCIAVDMECAAMLAVAKFREIKFAQFFDAADNLDAPDWDPRHLFSRSFDFSHRERYMLVALEAAVNLHQRA